MTDTKPEKTVVRRSVEAWAEVDPATYVLRPSDLDLLDGETVRDWIERQKGNGETPYAMAKDLDLLSDVGIYLQVIEHYDDGTTRCVDNGNWTADE